MPALPRELRKSLESTVIAARNAGEDAARAALSTLAVDRDRPFEGMSEDQRGLRRVLRAKERQLGSHEGLVSEIAYQHWHRMLFARFLAENGLLIHPEADIGVSLEEVADLAREEGEPDFWVLAARYASQMLPAIFREHDPSLKIVLAPEGRKHLESILASLPASVFTSDDALGWVYQFWQSEKKKQVNVAGEKIGAADLPTVTQLFTEDYMVRFLLENSLGAWWAARRPDSPLLESFIYLRHTDEGTPAADTFEGWPGAISNITILDPCCGSGHFLTAAFEMLVAMRVEEEGISVGEAGDSVIAENLFGLELDPRCTQIAAFSLALSAWRSGGYRLLPAPNIACSGIGVAGQLSEWRKLAEGDEDLENALTALHEQFRNASELGSLIDPRRATEEGHLFSVDYEKVAPLLERLLTREGDPETQLAGWAAAGIARAASLLSRTYTLVSTNVPYLSSVKQNNALKEFCQRHHPSAKADLATVMLQRARELADSSGAVALVTPQAWFFLGSYEQLRRELLTSVRWLMTARLGPGAFSTIGGEVVSVVLLVLSVENPIPSNGFVALDVSESGSLEGKAEGLRLGTSTSLLQADQLVNPDARIVLDLLADSPLLAQVADSYWGLGSGDNPRFVRCFWELPQIAGGWIRQLGSVRVTTEFGGREHIVLWEDGKGALAESPGAFVRGLQVWGKRGVLASQMGSLSVTSYTGEAWDQNCAPIIPKEIADLPAIWAYCTSDEFNRDVRRIDDHIKVTNATLVKVPFDRERWTKVAEELYPDGLPGPYSNDPTQWLFKGDPTETTEPLHAAVARLLGYRWPDQEPDDLDELADADGAVPIPALAGERPAAERLRMLLECAWGQGWSPGKLDELLTQAGAAGKDLDTWLRDVFFASHTKLFHNRPFIWHIWDGRKDGFSVLVNYHRLDRQLLDRITHTLLGSWIETQRDQVGRELPGAEARLGAAQELQRKLELIAHGDRPYDIYVRWKPPEDQPIGWDPDLNDGVRLNVRPFVTAGTFRTKISINWNKDRGKEPDGSERLNDLHNTRSEKEAARAKVGQRA